MKEMKDIFFRNLSLSNIVIILSALFVVYRIYTNIPKTEKNEIRLLILEKDIIRIQYQLNTQNSLLTELRADVKAILTNKRG